MGKHLDSFGRVHVGDLSQVEQMVFAAAFLSAPRSHAWDIAAACVEFLREEAKRRDDEAAAAAQTEAST